MTIPTTEFQFGLRGLFFVMTALALLLGVVIGVGELLGIGGPFALAQVLSQQAFHVPVYIVWLWGAALLWRRRDVHPLTSKYGLIGIGGLAAISLLSSLGVLWLQSAVVRGTGPRSSWMMWWWGYMLFHGIANGVFWVFIVKAMLRWRTLPPGSTARVASMSPAEMRPGVE